ncbi:hypothetical protein FRB98_002734 [Tulasnella sp. 332]|nr:hypothetical protein FRB98_002734 [Tulasnella sp. 332]
MTSQEEQKKKTQDALTLYYRSRGDGLSNGAFHGDQLLGIHRPSPSVFKTLWAMVKTPKATANFVSSQIPLINKVFPPLNSFNALTVFSNSPEGSFIRKGGVNTGVTRLWDEMLHPPLSYLSDQFQYRTADGSFNCVTTPHLGMAGTPYAKSVMAKETLLGAKPDPGDIFDLLMARDEHYQESGSGLSSMLLYHATIIIHDIFRTNQSDFNIADTSSYLDLSPLYGHTQAIQDSIRTFSDGMLKPDTFAEKRLLNQPPGVCLMLVMYNRYHNYAARELKKINEGGRFSLPPWFYKNLEVEWTKKAEALKKEIEQLEVVGGSATDEEKALLKAKRAELVTLNDSDRRVKEKKELDDRKTAAKVKQDYDLFNTARLITSGLYINIAIHDYLKALMGLHANHNSTWVLDPRVEIDRQDYPRGEGNQVSVEFNLLYRFHCAVSKRDEDWAHDFLETHLGPFLPPDVKFADVSIEQFQTAMGRLHGGMGSIPPEAATFGPFQRRDEDGNKVERGKGGGKFDDTELVGQLIADMNDPIGQFGALNTPNDFKVIEMMGILQARKWGVATLNEFREFFGLPRHKDFKDISKNPYIQDKLRDLYEHVDKVELYPGAFCEGTQHNKLDPGDPESSPGSTLWGAIFSDAVTLVRSDRFYTIDWNVERLTAWGMSEVSPNNGVLKGSVFHRLIQRAFPGHVPFDNIAFSHPFYTMAKNTEIATKQKLVKDFNVNPFKAGQKKKTWIMNDYDNICRVLSPEMQDVFWSIACVDAVDVLPVLKKALKARNQPDPAFADATKNIQDLQPVLMAYFTSMTEDILARERVIMKVRNPDMTRGAGPSGTKEPDYSKLYSVDIVRDVAVPVITRFIADLLGFGDLLQTEVNPKGKYSENEVYKHITNVHMFTSFIADETKMLHYRKSFVESLQFLYSLTKPAVCYANAWIPKPVWLRNRGLKPHVAHIRNFGFELARATYREKKSIEEATATLLVTALFGASNAVVMFTEVLAFFLPTGHAGLYDANGKLVEGDPEDPPEGFDAVHGQIRLTGVKHWPSIQDLAEKNDPASDKQIEKYVLEAQRLVMKTPVARTVLQSCPAMEKHILRDSSGNPLPDDGQPQVYMPGDTVVLNVFEASRNEKMFPKPYKLDITRKDPPYLTYQSKNTRIKTISITALTGLIKTVARLHNLRRGHDTQGKLKTIDISALGPGFFNYMTPDWSQCTPFPTTWKVRYDGPSPGKGVKPQEKQDHGIEYLYQPWGPSHTGAQTSPREYHCLEPIMRISIILPVAVIILTAVFPAIAAPPITVVLRDNAPAMTALLQAEGWHTTSQQVLKEVFGEGKDLRAIGNVRDNGLLRADEKALKRVHKIATSRGKKARYAKAVLSDIVTQGMTRGSDWTKIPEKDIRSKVRTNYENSVYE